MGGAINRSLISVHFSISIYFLTVQTYKLMRNPSLHYPNKSRTSSYYCNDCIETEISKVHFLYRLFPFCVISGCVSEAITMKVIGGHGL